MRGTITIDENRCKGCELCISVCPKGVIQVADYFTSRGYRPAKLVDPDGLCTGCLLCSTICPDAAITVYRESPKPKVQSPKSAIDTLDAGRGTLDQKLATARSER